MQGETISVILDTSFLVAFYDLDDDNHKRADEFIKEFEGGKFGRLIISDYIFDETITLLKKYIGNKKTTEIGKYLLNSLEFIGMETRLFELSWDLSKKFDELSFTDCSIIATMKHYNIDYLATFDSGFNGFVKVIK